LPFATPPTTAAPVPRKLVESEAKVTFPSTEISGQALMDRIQQSAEAVLQQRVPVRVSNPAWDGKDNSTYHDWTVLLPLNRSDATKVLNHAQAEMTGAPAWQTSSEIGSQVSKDTQWRAIGAVLISLFGIAAYVWFRFHQLSWGIAAIVSLAHDTLIMLGAIAASYWLAPYLGFLGIEQFKIDLPTVAAFLTLIGYSINDTIVIFDRIREVRGKSPDLTAKIINDSVNQTLARSILTSLTVLMVVVILYFVGGPGIHTFAFSLVVGAIAGSYSSIFIASPMLLWLLGHKTPAKSNPEVRQPAKTTV
jgi:SecD/SecF fusion protein